MRNMWKLWLASVLALSLLAACGSTATKDQSDSNKTPTEGVGEQATETSYPLTLTDAVGNEITFEAAPNKIVSMTASNTEILFGLGLNEEIVGVGDFDDYPAEANEKEKIGGQQFNVEKIVAMNPDIVFAHEIGLSTGEEGLQQIRDAGIPVFVVKNATNFEETYTSIETLGQATDKMEEAQKIVESMKAKVEDVLAKAETVEKEKTVFVETSPAPDIYTPGKGTFMQEMLDMIGAKNISADQEGWFVMDAEEIVNRNPEVIIVMYDYIDTAVEDVYKRPGFDAVTAIQDKAVIQVQENITSRTGPRLAEGLEEVAKAIYPEVFGE